MTHSTLEFDILTPILDKPLQLHFYYQDKLLYEYWLMPWETGNSNRILFKSNETIIASEIHITNHLQREDVILEASYVNGIIQDVSARNKLLLKNIFPVQGANYRVIKFTDLPRNIHLSHSYHCNEVLYLAYADLPKASFLLKNIHQNFSCHIDLYQSNVTIPKESFLLSYENQQFSSSFRSPLPSLDGLSQQLQSTLQNLQKEHIKPSKKIIVTPHITYKNAS